MTTRADVVIVGGGPCGLFQIFELGLHGIHAHLVETLPHVGGQCTELYPDKPIYDIPALPVCGAQELVDRLMEQIEPFEAEFHLGEQVTEVAPRADGGFDVRTDKGTALDSGNIVVAGGAGSFEPVRLHLEGLDSLEGTSVFYAVKDPSRLEGHDVVIVGGGDSALDWALALHGKARSIAVVHRRHDFRAAPASVQRLSALAEEGEVRLLYGNVSGFRAEGDRLAEIEVLDLDGETERLACQDLLVFFGLSPKLGPIAHWGLALDKDKIPVDTERFQTNVEGIFAIGDVNTYPGKKKLILSGFHEAALAAFAIKERLNPGKKVHLQYTTTSSVIHERLGVK